MGEGSTCVSCGAGLVQGAKFCHACGAAAPLPVAVAGAVPPPVAPAPQASGPPPVVAMPPVQPVYQPPPTSSPIHHQPPVVAEATPATRVAAVEGPNHVAFETLTEVLDVTQGLARNPAAATALDLDPHVALALDTKLQQGFQHLVGLHGMPGLGGQAAHLVKTTSTNLLKGVTRAKPSLQQDPRSWIAALTLTAAEAELYNRCLKDVALRDGLEDRILRVCASCKLERIINADYEQMQKRRRTADMVLMWQRSIMRAISRSNADPNFVCVRCQGLEYSDRTIVLCPRCGTPNTTYLLGQCKKCHWNFVTRSPGEPPGKGRPKPEGGERKPRKVLSAKCATCGNPLTVPLDKIPREGLRGKCKGCGSAVTFRRPTSPPPDSPA